MVLLGCVALFRLLISSMISGNLYKDGINKIINSDTSKAARKCMLSGEWHTVCERCKIEEDQGRVSKRQWMNEKFLTEDTKNFISKTASDGTINEQDFKMKFWDLRLGNVCNFGCRICTESNNSSYLLLERKIPREQAVITMDSNKVLWNELLEKHLPECEEIHFFGGEPLLMKEMWDVLDRLIESKNTGVRLKYNTNMSTLTYRGKHIFDYWRKLNLNCLQMSIDDIGTRAEYQRFGTKWDKVMSNIAEVANEYNDLEFLVATSIFNIYYIDQLVAYFDSTFPNVPKRFYLNIVAFPAHLNPFALPTSIKKECCDKLDSLVEKYKDSTIVKIHNVDVLKHYINNQVTFKDDILSVRKKCIDEIEKFDKMRGESFEATHPEIAKYFFDEHYLRDPLF